MTEASIDLLQPTFRPSKPTASVRCRHRATVKKTTCVQPRAAQIWSEVSFDSLVRM